MKKEKQKLDKRLRFFGKLQATWLHQQIQTIHPINLDQDGVHDDRLERDDGRDKETI